MRKITITQKEFQDLGPMGVVEKMEAAGFKFARRSCPFQLAGEHSSQWSDMDRSMTYTQEGGDGEG